MDIGSILLSFALLLIVAAFIARPILDRQGEREVRPGQADALLAERENVLAALRDLDFDHTTGKIADGDYQSQRASLVSQGVAILKRLDAQGTNGHGSGSLEADIEAAIAARRRRSEAHGRAPASKAISVEAITCHNCGATAQADDKFCPKCGTALSLSCPACGKRYIAGDKFCGRCGTRLPALVEAA